MKTKKRNYHSLWCTQRYDNPPQIPRSSEEDFFHKAVDSLCLEADMCESLENYIQVLSDGMLKLLDLGIRKQDIIKHKVLFPKLIHLGEDIAQNSKYKSDMFYLGLFIDVQLTSKWFTKSFYQLISKSIQSIKAAGSFFSNAMKLKIEEMIIESNYALYKMYYLRKGLKLLT